MSRCAWCVSPYRQVAEAAIASGRPVSHVAVEYGLPRAQWYKHQAHAGGESSVVSLAEVRRSVMDGGGGPFTVIPRLEALLLDVAAAKQKWSDKPAVVVPLLRLEKDILGDVAKVRGELPQHRSMDVGEWEEWRLVADVLTRYPEAQRAVAAALSAPVEVVEA